MATRKKAGTRKTARKSAKSSNRRGAASKKGGRKMASSARKRGSVRKGSARKTSARKSSPRGARVKRVAQEVVQQAQVAVAAGVETLKDFGENLMDRVRTT